RRRGNPDATFRGAGSADACPAPSRYCWCRWSQRHRPAPLERLSGRALRQGLRPLLLPEPRSDAASYSPVPRSGPALRAASSSQLTIAPVTEKGRPAWRGPAFSIEGLSPPYSAAAGSLSSFFRRRRRGLVSTTTSP